MNFKHNIACSLLAWLWLPALVCSAESDSPNLMQQLLTEGIRLSQDHWITLSAPAVDPLDNPSDRMTAAARLASSTPWTRFSRKSSVAPVSIDMDYLRSAEGDRVGQRMHFAFVVHVPMDKLRDEGVMRRLISSDAAQSEQPDGFHSEPVNRDALESSGVEVDPSDSLSWLEFLLLKKVKLQGVIVSDRTETDDSLVISWKLDNRFTDRDPPHDLYRNQWVKIERNELGVASPGQPSGYRGAGGYLVATAIDGNAGASLIEGEIAFAEPAEWFSGSNLLRSKLPLIIQESVRRFRRTLPQ